MYFSFCKGCRLHFTFHFFEDIIVPHGEGIDLIDAFWVKEKASDFGATLCNIAEASAFGGAPEGFRPRDVLPSCQSVVVLARRFNHTTVNAKSTSPYTVVRNDISAAMNHLAVKLGDAIAWEGYDAAPIGSIGPDEYDPKTDRYRGTISLKHAAELAGMGRIGKNTLLVNDRYGNMIWLSAVLTSAALEPDPQASYETCIPGCRLCLDNCPTRALDGISINQKACFEHAFGAKNGGEWKIHCFTCRKICPNSLGIKKK
jgi:epoxyqueuosine reductase